MNTLTLLRCENSPHRYGGKQTGICFLILLTICYAHLELYSQATSEPPVAFAGAVELGDGWWNSSWDGTYNAEGFPCIFHLQHSFQYVLLPDDMNGVYLYDLNTQDWWWTDNSVYPWFFSFNRQTWSFRNANKDKSISYERCQQLLPLWEQQVRRLTKELICTI